MYMIKGLTLMTTLLLAQSAMLLDSSRSGKKTNNNWQFCYFSSERTFTGVYPGQMKFRYDTFGLCYLVNWHDVTTCELFQKKCKQLGSFIRYQWIWDAKSPSPSLNLSTGNRLTGHQVTKHHGPCTFLFANVCCINRRKTINLNKMIWMI